MKRVSILFIFATIVLFLSNLPAYAQPNKLGTPIVQYKLNNHDSITLKWNNVEGADAYYIYRYNIMTGKKVRYTSLVKNTNITINNLSPNTEYLFTVKAVYSKNNTLGKESTGIKLTTPKEWYYDAEYDIDYKTKKMVSYYYRTDYAKTKKEEINLGDIKAVDEIIYYDGWYYVIGDYDAITAHKGYPWKKYTGDNCRKCVARIKQNGTEKEILVDFYSTEGWGYSYQVENKAVYLLSYHWDEYETKIDDANQKLKRYYSDPKWCWLKKISLTSGEVETIIESRPINWFYYYNGNIYYEYDDTMVLTKANRKFNNHSIYISDWYYDYTGESVNTDEHYVYYHKMDNNGTNDQLISKHEKRNVEINNSLCIDNNLIVFKSRKSIYEADISNIDLKKIFESNSLIDDIYIVNQYIYFSEFSNPEKNKNVQYCRIKYDGTGLEKQDKPFEWFY